MREARCNGWVHTVCSMYTVPLHRVSCWTIVSDPVNHVNTFLGKPYGVDGIYHGLPYVTAMLVSSNVRTMRLLFYYYILRYKTVVQHSIAFAPTFDGI